MPAKKGVRKRRSPPAESRPGSKKKATKEEARIAREMGSPSEEEAPVDSVEDVFAIIGELEAQLESSYKMCDALEEDLAKTQDQVTQLLERNEEQTRRIRYLEDKIPELSTLREELEFAEQEKANEQARAADLLEQLGATEREVEQLTGALEEKTAQLKEVRADKVKLEYEAMRRGERSARLEALEAAHDTLQQAHEHALEQITAMESELSETQSTKSDLEKELKSCSLTLGQLQAEHAERESQNEQLDKENRRLQEQTGVLEKETANLISQLRHVERELSEVQAEKQRLEVELANTKKTMKDIHAALASSRAKTRAYASEGGQVDNGVQARSG